MFGCFFLSATGKPINCGKLGAITSFVLEQALLSLRNHRCFRVSVLRHNKANQFAPGGAGRGKPRRCLIRYVLREHDK